MLKKQTKILKNKEIGSHAFWISSDLELYQVALKCIGCKHTAINLNIWYHSFTPQDSGSVNICDLVVVIKIMECYTKNKIKTNNY